MSSFLRDNDNAHIEGRCAQIRVTGNGSKALPKGVSFPGAYDANDAGLFLKGDHTSHKTIQGYKGKLI